MKRYGLKYEDPDYYFALILTSRLSGLTFTFLAKFGRNQFSIWHLFQGISGNSAQEIFFL